MRRQWYVLGLAGFMALCGLAAGARSALAQKKDRAKPKEITVTGIVEIVEDKDGTFHGIRLVVDQKTVYVVIPNKQGKALKKLEGKKIQATGIIAQRGKSRRLRVRTFEEVREEGKDDGAEPGQEE